LQANPEIEEGIKTTLSIKAFRVKGSKVFVKVSDPKIALSDIATLDIDNPEITEHMGQKFVEMVTEEAEVIFLPLGKFNEIKQWAKEQMGKQEKFRKEVEVIIEEKQEVESNAGNTQDKSGSAILPTKDDRSKKE